MDGRRHLQVAILLFSGFKLGLTTVGSGVAASRALIVSIGKSLDGIFIANLVASLHQNCHEVHGEAIAEYLFPYPIVTFANSKSVFNKEYNNISFCWSVVCYIELKSDRIILRTLTSNF